MIGPVDIKVMFRGHSAHTIHKDAILIVMAATLTTIINSLNAAAANGILAYARLQNAFQRHTCMCMKSARKATAVVKGLRGRKDTDAFHQGLG